MLIFNSKYFDNQYQGVIIENKLNFHPHLSRFEKIISRNVGILTKLKYILTCKTLLTLYYTLLYPHLTYGILLWRSYI